MWILGLSDDGMDKIELYEFQAEQIHNTLRLVSNLLDSKSKKTSLDRDIIQAKAFIENALKGDIDKRVTRF